MITLSTKLLYKLFDSKEMYQLFILILHCILITIILFFW